jgi:hypothetical protein
MPLGGRGTPPSTSQRSWTYIMGPFQGQNCMNKEKPKTRNRCGLILCVAHYTYTYSIFIYVLYIYIHINIQIHTIMLILKCMRMGGRMCVYICICR